MKRRVFVLTLLGLLSIFASAAAYETWPFDYVTPIVLPQTTGTPLRLPLTSDVLQKSRKRLDDLRIVSEKGVETPYVIIEQDIPARTASRFDFTVVSYKKSEQGDEITLAAEKKTDESIPAYRALELHTTASDFNKTVRVYALNDNTEPTLISEDSIFDFSARVNLRKTTLTFPVQTARRLLLRINEQAAPTKEEEEMIRLSYKGLDLKVKQGTTHTPFRIDRFFATTADEREQSVAFDTRRLIPNRSFKDKQGNTIIELGEVNLPLFELRLSIENPYFHRSVEVWQAEENKEALYRQTAQGTVFRFPGMKTTETTLHVGGTQKRFLRLKIENGDNPELRVSAIEAVWVRTNLYFVAEAGQRYMLYVGSTTVAKPSYELASLISGDAALLMTYPQGQLGALQKNPTRDPTKDQAIELGSKAWFEQTAFMAVVVLVVSLLGIWLFILLRKLPKPGTD